MAERRADYRSDIPVVGYPLQPRQKSGCVNAFDYRSGIIAVTCSAKCNPTDFAMEHPVSVQDGRKVVKEGFKMILLDGRNCCGSVHQLKVEGGHEWTERLLRVTEVL